MNSNSANDVGGGSPQRDDGKDARGRFQAGVPSLHRSGGRPRGSRNKLAEDFLADLSALWEEQGEAVLRRAFFDSPVKVVDIVARLLPAKIEIRQDNPISEALSSWSYEKLSAALAELEARIVARASEARPKLIEVTPIAAETISPALAVSSSGGAELSASQIPSAPPMVASDFFAEYEAQLALEAGGDEDGRG